MVELYKPIGGRKPSFISRVIHSKIIVVGIFYDVVQSAIFRISQPVACKAACSSFIPKHWLDTAHPTLGLHLPRRFSEVPPFVLDTVP